VYSRPPGAFRIIDISRPLSPDTPVWPGDAPLEIEWVARIGGDSPVNLTRIRTSLHVGTHADAPLHVAPGAPAIDEIDLHAFVGPVRVVEVRPDPGRLIQPSDLGALDPADPPRVLLRTGTYPGPGQWPGDFAALAPETARLLVERETLLIGLDTPSVDPADSSDLPAHRILASGKVAWLENLDLSSAYPGLYWLAALPLRIRGGDGSPVRAVLLQSV
jgi:arylformamidase